MAWLLKVGVQIPVIPSMETSGKLNIASSHKESAKLKLGERVEMIVIVSFTDDAHAQSTVLVSGLNVYVALERLLKAGVQVPERPLVLTVGKVKALPSHKLFTKEKFGVIGGTITTVCCVEKRQVAVLLLSGVKVYIALFWLSKAGDHVPEMEFMETVGNVSCPFKQMESSKLKVGTVDGIILTVCCAGVGHPTAGVEIVGVNV